MSRGSRWALARRRRLGAGQRMRKPPSAATTSRSSGRLTADGGALVANDMHLAIRVPNTWYRAALEWRDPSHRERAASPHRRHAARRAGGRRRQQHARRLGLHQYLRRLERHRPARDRSREAGPVPHAARLARVRAVRRSDRGCRPTRRSTRRCCGPIWGPAARAGLPRPSARLPVGGALRRAAGHIRHAARVAPRTIEEAFDEANGLGTPGQNMVVADRSRTHRLDRLRLDSAAAGHRRHAARVVGRRIARLERLAGRRGVSAHCSTPPTAASGPRTRASSTATMLAKLGDGSYEIGSRARHHPRAAASRETTSRARDLLAIQLDTQRRRSSRAGTTSLLRTLTADAVAGQRGRAALPRAARPAAGPAHAAPDSAAYRLTRTFRDVVSERVMAFVLSECYEADPTFDYTTVRRRDAAILALVTEQPHAPARPAVCDVGGDCCSTRSTRRSSGDARGRSGDLRDRRWSECNVTGVPASVVGRHPAGRPLARHAAARAARRSLHAARALGRHRRVGADGRLARPRSRRHHAHADRTERPPALAVLRELARGVGQRANRRRFCPDPPHTRSR